MPIKVKEIKTMCFKDKNDNNVFTLDNVDEIALTSNVTEERYSWQCREYKERRNNIIICQHI